MKRARLPVVVPRPRLLALGIGAAVLLALGTLSPVFVGLAVVLFIAAIGLAIADYRLAPALGAAEVGRVAEPQLIIGAPNRVGVTLRNPTTRPLRLRVRDEVPVSFAVSPRVNTAVLAPAGTDTVAYVARPRYRGSFRFGALHTRQRGPLDLVERQSDIAADAPAHVYPDLREIRRYEVSLRRGLAYDAGQRRARLPGAGSVFERLREYGPDDDPRSISWTATARRGRPISVEYETERQQRVLILLDAGRMMASTLGELTKLDHAVNTALMLSYVATVKGDEVGLLGFADDVRSYLLPRRGRRQFLRVTEELRRLEVTTTEPDYRAAFEFLRSRTSRRALVVLFTDLVDVEASRSLVAAVNRLAGNNLVLCCLLADPQLAEIASRTPRSTTELYERVAAEEVRDARARALALLRERGVHVVDVPAERLTVAAIQRYLELKKRWL
ncbi:MAG TPA: DUF58 domain-containing protein [Candidatus Limnocylindria bacterium]|nr:DUF58 domain-containing protein [Candidatus Limnocylindria bacterium]